MSAPLTPCCVSTESGTVAVAQYRSMLGIREQSAPTDAPTPSGLIARRWNEEARKGEDHRRGSYLSAAPMAKRHTADGQVFVIAGHRDRRGRSGRHGVPAFVGSRDAWRGRDGRRGPEDLVSEDSPARQRAMRRAAPRGTRGLSSLAGARLPTCLLLRRTATAGDGRRRAMTTPRVPQQGISLNDVKDAVSVGRPRPGECCGQGIREGSQPRLPLETAPPGT